MTFGEMHKLMQRFTQIKSGSQVLKHKRFNNMLNDLVQAYESNDVYARHMYLAVCEEMEG